MNYLQLSKRNTGLFKLVLIMFCITYLSLGIKAQTYTYNVGERRNLPTPTPPTGIFEAAGVSECNKSDCVTVNGLSVFVHKYFSGTATVTVPYQYSYINSYTNKRDIGDGIAYYYIKCEATTVTLNKSEVEINVGEEIELTYKTNPSNLTPLVTWTTSDKAVAHLSDDDHWGKDIITNSKTITVTGNGEGTCTIKCEGNTGKTAPTCIVKVIDMNWVKADVPSGVVDKGTKVTLTCTKSGATIYYTTDDSEPTKSSTKYTSPIVLNNSMTLKAKAFFNNQESNTLKREYRVYSHKEGEVFKYTTIEGVKLSLLSQNGSLIVSSGSTSTPAIDKNYSGAVTIPNAVDGMRINKIGEKAFSGCKITSCILPDKDLYTPIFFICKNAFQDCQNLKDVTIPNGMSATIEKEAFLNCESITTVNFMNHISGKIEEKAFYNCKNIKTINSYLKTVPKINDNVFYATTDIYKNAILYVPKGYVYTYGHTSGWSNFKNIKEIGDTPKLVLSAEPSGGSVSSGTNVYLTVKADGSTISGADIYYTTDGTTPSKYSTKYYPSSGIAINYSCTLKAIAYKDGYETSNVLSVSYTVKSTPKLVLSASPSGGSVSSGTNVYLTVKADGSTISGADIYYTTDGTTPSKYSTKYYPSSGIAINYSCTLKAIAYKDGYETSNVLSVSYTVKSTPKLVLSASPSGGSVSSGSKVYLAVSADGYTVSGADIYYTTDGTTPSKYSTKYYSSSGIAINYSCTLKAIAYKDGYETSNVLSVSYTVKSTSKLVLSASPSGGSVSSGTRVYLAVSTDGYTVSGAEIYYTTDGTTPSKYSTNYYPSSCITIYNSCTVKAIAYKDGYETSNVLSVSYTVKSTPKLVLSASPSGGSVSSGTNVYLTVKADGSTISGADVYYTLDGNSPTKNSMKYYSSSGITINNDCTLRAVAFKDGYQNSDEYKTTYTIVSNPKTVDDIEVCIQNYILCFDKWNNNGTTKPYEGMLFGDGFFLNVSGGNVSTSKGKVNLSVVNNADNNHVTQYIVDKYGIDFPDDHFNSWKLKDAQDVIAMKVTAKTKLIFFLQGNNKSGTFARIPKIATDAKLTNPLNDAPDADFPTTDAGFRYEWIAPEDMTIYIGSYNGDIYLSYLIVETSSSSIDENEPAVPSGWEKVITNGNLANNDVSCFFKTESGSDLMPATISEGTGKNNSRGIVVHSGDNPEENWDTMFFIRTKKKLGDGTKMHIEFDYKASQNAICETQAFGEPQTEFLHYSCIGNVNFTTEWQHFNAEIDITDILVGMQTIAFKLAFNKTATTYYFDNIVVWAKEENDSANVIEINATNFPDENFRNYLLGQDYGKDGIITKDEIGKIVRIDDIRTGSIDTMQGVEYFTDLKELHCDFKKLTSLDVSKNMALKILDCGANQLTSLNISRNTALEQLDCYSNQLTSLDVSKNTALEYLSCSNNQLTSLDVSKNTALKILDCGANKLTSLDISRNTALEQLVCYKNPLTSLDVSKNTAMTLLWCATNQLTSLDVSRNTALKQLFCLNNQLTSLDVSKNTVLEELDCSANQLKSLDLSKNTKLEEIHCYENQLNGSEMDKFITSLPQNTTDGVYKLYIISNSISEKNVCTKMQVAAIKAKGWTPMCYNGTYWVEYEGSDDGPTEITLPITESVNIGETITLTPTIVPEGANTTLTWESDDTSIAKVNQSGIVMGIKEGTAIISVTTSNNHKAECFVVVKDPAGINNIEMDRNSNSTIYTLSGQRLHKPRKGINIIGGKKVVMK